MMRTEASLTLSLIWDPRKGLEPEDLPAVRAFVAATEQMMRLNRVHVAGPLAALRAMVPAEPDLSDIVPAERFEVRVGPEPPGLGVLEQARRRTVIDAFAQGGTIMATAGILGVSERNLLRDKRKYGIVVVKESCQALVVTGNGR